jgi:drug/metabolite transporter (DMT)-like permease
MLNPAYALAGVGSVLFGAADFCGGVAARRAPAVAVTVLSGFAAIAVLLAGVPIDPGVVRAPDMAWAAGAGAFGGIGAALIYRALAIGPVSVASPVLCLVGLALPVIVGIALGERPAPVAILGLALVPLAIVLLARSSGESEAADRGRVRRVLVPSILAGLACGVFLTCFGRIQEGAGLWPLVLARVIGVATLIAWSLAQRAPLMPAAPARAIALLAGVLDSLANVAYVVAVQRGTLSLVAAIVSLAPATAVLLARVLLGERWSPAQRVGLIAALGAGACISLG